MGKPTSHNASGCNSSAYELSFEVLVKFFKVGWYVNLPKQ